MQLIPKRSVSLADAFSGKVRVRDRWMTCQIERKVISSLEWMGFGFFWSSCFWVSGLVVPRHERCWGRVDYLDFSAREKTPDVPHIQHRTLHPGDSAEENLHSHLLLTYALNTWFQEREFFVTYVLWWLLTYLIATYYAFLMIHSPSSPWQYDAQL